MRGLILLIALAGSANALEAVTVTIDSVSSTDTVRGIDISSAPSTSVIVSTNPGYRQVCVQNLDTTAFLACSDSVNVSTISTNNLMGVVVPPAGTASTPLTPLCFSVVAGNNWYCRTSSVSASTRAVIVRGR